MSRLESLDRVLREAYHASKFFPATHEVVAEISTRPKFRYLTAEYVKALGLPTAEIGGEWGMGEGVEYDGHLYVQEFEGQYRLVDNIEREYRLNHLPWADLIREVAARPGEVATVGLTTTNPVEGR